MVIAFLQGTIWACILFITYQLVSNKSNLIIYFLLCIMYKIYFVELNMMLKFMTTTQVKMLKYNFQCIPWQQLANMTNSISML